MIYLALAIGCSSSIALIFKHSETAGMNRYAVTTANYLMAAALSAAILGITGLALPEGGFSLSASLAELRSVFVLTGDKLPVASSALWAVIVGLGAGAFFFLAFLYYQKSIREQGVGLAGAFIKLGILVPMSLSLVLWQEFPTTIQWIGIALALLSIVIVHWPSELNAGQALRLSLVLLFLFGGIAEFSNKVFQKYGWLDHQSLFLLVTFASAFIYSLIVTLRASRSVQRRDVLTGLLVGVPNLFSSFFLIRALETIPAAVAFPAFGAGTILVINLVGVTAFGERLNRLEKAAVGLTMLALVLINQ